MELVDKDLELFRQYQELQKKGIINCQIAAQLQITKERLASIISHYTFKTGLEYKIQEQEGTSMYCLGSLWVYLELQDFSRLLSKNQDISRLRDT